MNMPLSRTHFQREAKEELHRSFCDHLKQHVKPSKLCKSYPDRGHFLKPRTVDTLLTHPQSSVLFKLRTGHTGDRVHRSRVSRDKTTSCRFCHEYDETAKHLLFFCAELKELTYIRQQIWLCYGNYNIAEIATDYEHEGPDLLTKLNILLRRKGVWL